MSSGFLNGKACTIRCKEKLALIAMICLPSHFAASMSPDCARAAANQTRIRSEVGFAGETEVEGLNGLLVTVQNKVCLAQVKVVIIRVMRVDLYRLPDTF